MFYVLGTDGITVTETGRKTLFIPKDHDKYNEIKENITKMSYQNVFDMVDVKTLMCGLLSETTETYYNDNDDLEVFLTSSAFSEGNLKEIRDAIIFAIFDKIEDKEKREKVLDILKNMNLVSLKVAFE